MVDAAPSQWLDKVFQRSAALGIEARVRALFEPRLRHLVRVAPTLPPDPSTAADRELARSALSLLRVVPELGTEFLRALADVADDELEGLLRVEYETADTLRKLVVHHLREAVRSYATFGRAVAVRVQRLELTTWAQFGGADEVDDIEQLTEDAMHTLRGAAALFVATTRLHEGQELEHWAKWAHLAAREARRFEATIHVWLAELDSDLPELRAKAAWKGWDTNDVAREFAPWPGEARR